MLRGRYVIQDISGYERHEAEKTLLTQLDFGKRIANERGTLTTEQVRGIFDGRVLVVRAAERSEAHMDPETVTAICTLFLVVLGIVELSGRWRK